VKKHNIYYVDMVRPFLLEELWLEPKVGEFKSNCISVFVGDVATLEIPLSDLGENNGLVGDEVPQFETSMQHIHPRVFGCSNAIALWIQEQWGSRTRAH